MASPRPSAPHGMTALTGAGCSFRTVPFVPVEQTEPRTRLAAGGCGAG